jgi:integrase
MPVTKRPEGSYQVTVSYGGRTARRSSRWWTYQDARRVEREMLAQVRAAAAGIEPERTLGEALERWLDEHVPRLANPRKLENFAKHLLPFIAGRKLSEAPQVWAEVKKDLAGKSPATINHRGRILRQVCNLAMKEWGWTDVPIGSRIRLLPEQPRESFLTPEQVEALALACPSPEVGDYVRLAAYTGIRKGHLLRLTARDVKDGWITLDRSSKTRTLQTVPLHPKVAGIAERLPLGVSENRLDWEWRAARKAAGIDCRFHDLRHTCASWLVQAGVPLLTVRDFLGHSTVAVTQRYAHLQPAHLRDAVMKLA